jgi:hypothetical protein
VNVSKILQFFSYLNGYGVLLCILLIYEIASSNPRDQAHVIVLVLIAIYLLDCAKEPFFLKPLLGPFHCNTLAFVLHPSRFYFIIELKKEENLLRPRVTYTLVVVFP